MPDPLFSVADQVVLVSGGSRGIGAAIAAGFARREARVVISGRHETTLKETAADISRGAPHPVSDFVADVAERRAAQRLVDHVLGLHGRIDTLINVAGVNRRKPALEVSEEDYDFVLDINLKGAFQLSQCVAKGMMRQGAGSQINIGSLTTDRPLVNVAPYAMSKAALGQMSRALALEWGPSGIRVNTLAPGFILTDLTESLWSSPEMLAWGERNTPLGRLGRPDDLLGAALFLASPASAFLTGQTLYVDGGFGAGWRWPIPS